MGPALCLFSAVCFGALPIFGTLAAEAGVAPGTLLLLRFAIAATVLATLALLRPRRRLSCLAPLRHRGRPVLVALALGAVGYATQAELYFAALTRIDAPLVSLVLYTYPALVTAAAVVLGRERLTPRRAAALGTSSCGTLLVLLGAGGVSVDLLGVALAFGSSLTYTAYILVADTAVRRLPPVVLAAWVMTGATGTLAVRALVVGDLDLGLGPAGWLWVGCTAVLSTVLAMLAFFAGLRRSGPATAAILSTVEPIVTTALAALVLDQFLTALQLAGALLVLASVVVLQRRTRPRRPHLPAAHADHATAAPAAG